MNCEIIAVGTELLLGQIVNTNASYISEKLASCGIDVYHHTVVGDNPVRIKSVFKNAMERSSIVISTGGLGPTDDDLTKEVVSELLNLPLKEDQQTLLDIQSFFKTIGREMTPNNKKQALIPLGSIPIKNNNGTAPGIHLRLNEHNKEIFLFPGPPSEIKPMIEEYLLPYLMTISHETIVSEQIYFAGIGESALETKIKDLIDKQSNPTIAPLASEDHVRLRITAKSTSTSIATNLINETIEQIKERVGEHIFSYTPRTIQEVVLEILKSRNLTLSIAESCTGGMLSSSIVDIPGSSDSFTGGIVSYHNDVKSTILKVKEETLSRHGAVSKEVAIEMANGARTLLGTNLGVSITGIAGPSGETLEKPIGLIYIALSNSKETICKEIHLKGNRDKIRKRATFAALYLLWKHLKGLEV